MPGSKWRSLLIVIKRALSAPLSVGLLAAGILWAMLLHDSMIGGLGLVTAIAVVIGYVLAKLQDETFIRSALQAARARERMEEARKREFRIEELDVESRVKMKAIARLQSEIAEEVEKSPVDEVAIGLTDTVTQTEELLGRGLALAQKRRELQRYLSKTDENAIEMRIAVLQSRLAEETDPARKPDIETSLAAKQHELEDYRAIQDSAGGVLGQLDAIECSFASLRARLVRIKSTDISEWTAANTELQTELCGLNTSVDALEQSISEAISLGG